jgi:hypothetical protein
LHARDGARDSHHQGGERRVDPVNAADKSNVDELLRYTASLPGYIFNRKPKGLAEGDYEVVVNCTVPGGPCSAIVTLVK